MSSEPPPPPAEPARSAAALEARIAAAPKRSGAPFSGEVDLPEVAEAPLPRQLGEIQLAMREQGLEGWLLYDHRGQSPLVPRALGLRDGPLGHLAQRLPEGRYFYWVSALDMPALIVHEADAEGLPVLPGDVILYSTYAELRSRLGKVLPNRGTIAMEHSPVAACPDLSRVDAGTIELVRGLGVKVGSSIELVNRFLGPWSEAEAKLHDRARSLLLEVRKEVAGMLAAPEVREGEVREAAISAMERAGLYGPQPRITSGVHTRRRVHGAHESHDRAVSRGDLVLVDLMGRLPRGPFAHVAMTAVKGEADAETSTLFRRVASAKDGALAMLEERFAKDVRTLGYEVDRTMRAALGDGQRGRILTRGGHHLGFVPWSAEACTFDDTEIHDTREALVGHAWSVHPALYEGERCMRVQATVRRTEKGLSVIDAGPSELTVL